ncbi:unnamed protein product [Schistosoma curassoni]|uniref:Secreted protein n=1 Tax=Schistosoma curassoni TaxID=6186 RepID=A0A183KVK2_9TREM|nr:unnamed protein product [Schistosoma curassoni]
MFLSCKYAALALSIRAFTSTSDPPCSSVMLPRYMVVGGSRQETLDPGFVLLGTRQLVLLGGFDPVTPSFTVRDVTTELSD